jgi:HSP20 family protein
MTALTAWKKEELDKLRKDLGFLFRRFRQGFGVPRAFLEGADMFATTLTETEDYIVFKTELTDVRADDIQLSVTDDRLHLAVKSSQDSSRQGTHFQSTMTRTRSLSRSIALPCRIVADDVKATYQDNILEIKLRKCRPEKARGITIEVK